MFKKILLAIAFLLLYFYLRDKITDHLTLSRITSYYQANTNACATLTATGLQWNKRFPDIKLIIENDDQLTVNIQAFTIERHHTISQVKLNKLNYSIVEYDHQPSDKDTAISRAILSDSLTHNLFSQFAHLHTSRLMMARPGIFIPMYSAVEAHNPNAEAGLYLSFPKGKDEDEEYTKDYLKTLAPGVYIDEVIMR